MTLIKPRKKRRVPGSLWLFGALLVTGLMLGQNPERLPFVRKDFLSMQGNYLGAYSKGSGRWITLWNDHMIHRIRLADGVEPKLPAVTGLIEVKYLNQNGVPTMINEDDLQYVFVENNDPDAPPGVPTMYQVLE